MNFHSLRGLSRFLAALLLLCPTLRADESISTTALDSLPEDPAAEMVGGIDRFLLRKIEHANSSRDQYWKGKYSIESNRKFLSERLGLEATRHPATDGIVFESPTIASGETFDVYRIRWPVLTHPAPQSSALATLWGEGLYLGHRKPAPLAIIVPDASESPEQYLPSEGSLTAQQSFVLRLASKMNVVIVATTSREIHQHGGAKLSRREYLHRSAFELGRTLTGYELQMVQAIIDRMPDADKVLVQGQGEGGMVALMAGAIDPRIDLTMVGSYFERRDEIWKQPISRQVFGLLERFSDAHLATMILPRGFIAYGGPEYSVQLPGGGGAPATWNSPKYDASNAEYIRYQQLSRRLFPDIQTGAFISGGLSAAIDRVESLLDLSLPKVSGSSDLQWHIGQSDALQYASRRADRQLAGIDAHSQAVLAESDYQRGEFMNLGYSRTVKNNDHNQLDTSSVEAYVHSVERFRTVFREQTIGWFKDPLLPPAARSVESYKGNGWTGHAVVMDVFPDVFAFGQLLMPDDIEPGERRPVVVCQHGLEGRPKDTIIDDHRAYHDFSARLAAEGFIVFAPQNPYIGYDHFRTLQRKSYPIGKTLFSVIGAQHQQIIRWLKSMESVDPDRIAFYGLSYGGKSAMRLPALLPEYCLSICSADFNDWVWKNASSRSRYSYIGTGEYEIFEFGLGKTFNYAEMAALIAPRPFMVERGHYDGVAPDDRVGKEFGKVRHLYQARLKLQGHCEIEWFDGPHTINGQGTFAFLRRHLNWNPDKQ